MARFIMANRRVSRSSNRERARSRLAVDSSYARFFSSSSDLRLDHAPDEEFERRVISFDASPLEVLRKREQLSNDVLIEEAIAHYPVGAFPPLDLKRPNGSPPPLPLGKGKVITVHVEGPGGPLAHATVRAWFRQAGTATAETVVFTALSGSIDIEHDPAWHLAGLVVAPYADHWTMLVRPGPNPVVHVLCPLLPSNDIGWWHQHVGLSSADGLRGAGIKVGVVDTGCGSHPALAHVHGIGAFVRGVADPHGTGDVDCHGTHVCGTIGARGVLPQLRYEGIAPGAELFAARVFADADSGADQGDIVAAIDVLSRVHQVDLLNLSLGAASASQIEHDAILDALDLGTLCICAAGNDAPNLPALNYPAAFPECVSVSALGLDNWAPPGSLSSARLPSQAEHFGHAGLFLANFSCHGGTLTTAAPGVGIIAPVPQRHGLVAPYSGMDGTSMAAPVACGALANLLSADAAYRTMQRNDLRAEKARQLLTTTCQDRGLSVRYQGHGICRAL